MLLMAQTGCVIFLGVGVSGNAAKLDFLLAAHCVCFAICSFILGTLYL